MIGAAVKPKTTLRLSVCTQKAILFLLPGGTLELCCVIKLYKSKFKWKTVSEKG